MKKKIFICTIITVVSLLVVLCLYNIFIRTWKTNVNVSSEDISQIKSLQAISKEQASSMLNDIGQKIKKNDQQNVDSENYVEVQTEFTESSDYKEELNMSFNFYNKENRSSNSNLTKHMVSVSIYISHEAAKLSSVDFASIEDIKDVYDNLYGKNKPIFNKYLSEGNVEGVKYFISPVLIDSKSSQVFGTPFLKSTEGHIDAIYEVGDFITIKIFEITNDNSSYQQYVLNYLSNIMNSD